MKMLQVTKLGLILYLFHEIILSNGSWKQSRSDHALDFF